MSLFGKKGLDDSETARQLAIKKSLNKELSTGIKTLQRDHISSDSAIRSGDTANRICNVLEAIFLHELKDSYASKLSSWSSMLAPSGAEDVASVSSSFWPFVMKFTHKDVVSQIKTLSLINNEVGYCRAWIRMGLNDCLMDSYVDAMLCDAKTIKTYYKRSAFLRESEQPHIMKNYLQGLGNFAFQLSFNSSVLNIWGAAPMIAAGSWSPPKDSPVSEPSTPRCVGLSGSGLVHQYSDPTSTYSRAYSSPKTKQVDSPLTDPQTVPHAIQGSFHESEISSNLLQSPPDDEGALVVAMVTENRKLQSPRKGRMSKQNRVETSQDEVMDYGKAGQMQDVQRTEIEEGDDDLEESKTKKIKQDVLDEYVNIESPIESKDDKIDSNLDSLFKIQSDNVIPPNPFVGTTPANPFDEPIPDNPFDKPESTSQETNPTQCDGPGGVNPFDKNVGPNQFDEPNEGEFDKSKKMNENASDIGVVEKTLESSLESDVYGKPQVPDVDVDVSPESSRQRVSAEPSQEKESSNIFRGEEYAKHDDFEDSFQGNSLGARCGWSSSFEHQANTPTSPVAGGEATLPGDSSTARTALASYKSLLEDYAAQGTTGALPDTNWEDLLGRAPGTDLKAALQASSKDKEGRLTSISGLSEADISAEYEVIPFSSSPTSKYADTRTQSLLNIVTVIGREKGLDSQNYQCKGCSRPVGIIYGKANVCSYDGGYYCYECHTDDEAIIPAKILYSWDFRKHKVSKHTKTFLQQIEAMPLIDVEECNPSLYKAIPELADIRILRSQLKYLKAYLFTCQQSVAEELRKKVWPREYMLEHMHLYSTQDFLQIQGGNLSQFLKRVIVFAAKHVQQCPLCSQKGFICEICTSDKVIYPFDVELTVRCERCTTVFHKACKTDAIPCPKCDRRRIRRGHPQFHGSQEEVDFATPFT